MKLVAVDQQTYHDAKEIAALLESEGLHPSFDDLPRFALKGHTVATTPIYVPEDEAERARQVLAAHYEGARERMRARLDGWWLPLVPVFILSVGIGVFVGVRMEQPMPGLAAWLISFLMLLQLMSLMKGWRGRKDDHHT